MVSHPSNRVPVIRQRHQLCSSLVSGQLCYRVQQERPDTHTLSCVSTKSDWSMGHSKEFRKEYYSDGERQAGRTRVRDVHWSACPESTNGPVLRIYECFESPREDEGVLDIEDEKQENSAREGDLEITLHVLRNIPGRTQNPNIACPPQLTP
ncbi:uncharacterized protein ACWYII_005675 [Salvelinus alpinus]